MMHYTSLKRLRLAILAAIMLAALISQNAVAQDYSFYPGKKVNVMAKPSEYADVQVDIQNLSSAELKIRWRLIENGFPQEWDYSLCDNGNCYPGIPDGAVFSPVAPGNAAFLKISVMTGGLPLTASVKIGISEENGSAEDTVTFSVFSGTISSVEERPGSVSYIFPDPVKDECQLSGIDMPADITVYNVLGEKVVDTFSTSASRIDLKGLESGHYFIRINDRSGNTLVQKFQKY